MRVVGAVVFLIGAIGAGVAIGASYERSRAVAAAFGLAAPIAVLAAVTGLVLVFVPGFLG